MNARRVIVRSERRWMRFWFFEQRWALCHNFHGEKISGGSKDSPTIVKRNAALAMIIATQRSLILLRLSSFARPLLLSSFLRQVHATTLTTRTLRVDTSKSYDRRRIVESCVLPFASSRLSSRRTEGKGTRVILAPANGTCVCRLDCATGRSGRERLRKGGSWSQIALASRYNSVRGLPAVPQSPFRRERRAPVSFPSRKDPPRGDSRVDLLSYPRAKPLLACPNKIVLVL